MRRLVLAAVLVLTAVFSRSTTPDARADELVVCPTCPLHDLSATIATIPPGSTIRVRGGNYLGPIVLDRPLTLIGEDWPVIDGKGTGTVVRITAPDVHLQGFVIRGSGTSHDHEDSGILVQAPRVAIVGNHVLDSLFGIQLLDAPDGLVQDNLVIGKPLPEPQRGDGIKLWYSPRARVLENHVQDSRDVLVWYSDGTLVQGNRIERGRYGVHVMYSNESTVERNILRDNSVGIYFMYGARQTVRYNAFLHNRGPSGYGLALKETDGATIEGNLMLHNRVGLYLDNSPLSDNTSNRISGNWIAYNDIGLLVTPATRRNLITANVFLENLEQAAPQGGGTLAQIAWAENGRGNFWSDYVGYDTDRDGIGDLPYTSRALSSVLTDREPLLAFFRFSLAMTALDLAVRTVPVFQPPPRFADPAPLVQPMDWPPVPWQAGSPSRSGALLPLSVVTVLLLFFALGLRRPWPAAVAATHTRMRTGMPVSTIDKQTAISTTVASGELAGAAPIIDVHDLTKRFADRVVLDRVSFSVFPGEAIALWGPNGAGKTTILRCLLGRTTFEGVVNVFGRSPLREGPAVRARIGYVPQQLPLLDLSVSELVLTIAQLRGEPLEQAWQRLERFGLQQVWWQPVRTLSGGMQQRLALALATIGDPPLLLLDEPTANLDTAAREDLLTILEQLRDSGRTIVFASHRPDDIWRLATRVLRIEAGRVVAEVPVTRRLQQDGQVLLVLNLEPDTLQPAWHLLTAHGFTVYRDGQQLRLVVPASRKGEPFFVLARVGIAVQDFHLEESDGW
ncbi:nitrous oxide reductase family maturation protein NosD [Thermomicrobium sp. 4228-Ro]|uniref:nitrous oxide reductase family maturation protein NosD n=1 Tax=Thermomicrobium sp. 4228-Ro TaxID=2993937 RepID=UPI002248A695|nr:nitrous oxide reductase family maturation protein NosD [Thermomicrobium sp. 4228-Ro]MCX2728197.1 nitrous oxide reductase family maturation protein NosD [Thermomicrobium sp. 4228-Ro]